MDLPPQILALIPRDEPFWSECRTWAAPAWEIVLDPRRLADDRPPLAILIEGSARPTGPDESSQFEHNECPADAQWDGDRAADPTWIDHLEHPDLPWSWRQWVDSEQTRLVVLDAGARRFHADHWAQVLPADVTARELGLLLTQIASTARVQQERLLERQRGERYAKFALRDPLTGLPNRRAWQLFLRRHASPAGEAPASCVDPRCCVALVDVDYFKQLNSTFGHATADQVLRRVGRSLRDDLRSGDLAARLGGDEFGIVLSPSPRAAAADVLHRVRRSIRDQLIQSRLPAVTVSIGFTEFPISRDDSVRQAVRRAAEALRWAKAHQRNSVVGCDPRWPASSHLA
ncbi:MAG: GGDEF domain-containing protein [Pirellulales bacterium]